MRPGTDQALLGGRAGIQLPLRVKEHPAPRQPVALLRCFQRLVLFLVYLDVDVLHVS